MRDRGNDFPARLAGESAPLAAPLARLATISDAAIARLAAQRALAVAGT